MSDIKNIKDMLAQQLKWFPALEEDPIFKAASSLITTIESQKEEIERNEDRFKELLRSRISEDNAKIWKLEAEVKSLKAITDLAVKGLKHLISFPYIAEFVDVDEIAKSTLSEIARLQNE